MPPMSFVRPYALLLKNRHAPTGSYCVASDNRLIRLPCAITCARLRGEGAHVLSGVGEGYRAAWPDKDLRAISGVRRASFARRSRRDVSRLGSGV